MQLQLSLAVADRLHETLLVRGEPLGAVEAARLLLASPSAPEPICREVVAALLKHDQRFCAGAANDSLSLRHWETPDPDLAEVPFVALDLETTGARAGLSKITEIGAVRLHGFKEVGRFHSLVNPQRPIPPMISQITGITQQMVADAPRIEEVVPDLLEFLEGAVIVAHNAAFDVGFLNYELQRLRGRRLGEGAIDTLPLARLLAPGLPNYRLGTVAEALGAPVVACHRALADAEAVGHVFVTLVGRLQERGITRLGESRVFVSPSTRVALDKLRLTRDVPRTTGTYQFLDRHGNILYVGKADHLRERVRSYFVARNGHTRKVRQAVQLVERIDWNETCTPLEAVVHEQELILEHRPPCNVHGSRPENYTYLKVSSGKPGLNLSMSTRVPRWLGSGDAGARPSQVPVVIGPFRGRARMGQALDLLHRCYPIRRCPRGTDVRPCVRRDCGDCLAPCVGDSETIAEHDALVTGLMEWLAGEAITFVDPVERADDLVLSLSRRRRFEEAKRVREARDDLLSVRRSYQSLIEALALRFVALWPALEDDGGLALRVNIVWRGRLREAVSLPESSFAEDITARLDSFWACEETAVNSEREPAAVLQEDLDRLLAVRRWFKENGAARMVGLPGADASPESREQAKNRVLVEGRRALAAWPQGGPAESLL